MVSLPSTLDPLGQPMGYFSRREPRPGTDKSPFIPDYWFLKDTTRSWVRLKSNETMQWILRRLSRHMSGPPYSRSRSSGLLESNCFSIDTVSEGSTDAQKQRDTETRWYNVEWIQRDSLTSWSSTRRPQMWQPYDLVRRLRDTVFAYD